MLLTCLPLALRWIWKALPILFMKNLYPPLPGARASFCFCSPNILSAILTTSKPIFPCSPPSRTICRGLPIMRRKKAPPDCLCPIPMPKRRRASAGTSLQGTLFRQELIFYRQPCSPVWIASAAPDSSPTLRKKNIFPKTTVSFQNACCPPIRSFQKISLPSAARDAMKEVLPKNPTAGTITHGS